MTKFEKETRYRLYVFVKKKTKTKKKKTADSAICATVHYVHLHRHDVSTVLLHCPITSITRKLSYWCLNRLVITNHVVIVLIICNTNYLSNGLNSHDTFPFIKTYCLHCYSQILTNSWSSDSSIKIHVCRTRQQGSRSYRSGI